jgi:hypothetical protein
MWGTHLHMMDDTCHSLILSLSTVPPYHLLPWSSNHHYPYSTHFIFQYNLIPSQWTLLSFHVQIYCSSLVTWKVMLILLAKCENTLEPFLTLIYTLGMLQSLLFHHISPKPSILCKCCPIQVFSIVVLFHK